MTSGYTSYQFERLVYIATEYLLGVDQPKDAMQAALQKALDTGESTAVPNKFHSDDLKFLSVPRWQFVSPSLFNDHRTNCEIRCINERVDQLRAVLANISWH